jgi:HAD superfamily hydrolase (TIGR01450 family)
VVLSMSGSGGVSATFGSCPQPLAEVHDVALLDLDGVVYIGTGAVPHAAASLDSAAAAYGMRSVFVTNNAARPPEVVAEHLVELGVRATARDVVTSAQAGARILAERLPAGSRVLCIGGAGVPAALRERGLVPVETVDDDPVALMQGFGPKVGWEQLAEGSLAIERGLVWVATNVDATIPSPRGRVLGNGSLVAALRHATGAEPLVAGKPLPPLMQESVDRSAASNPIVVGDRLDTDIEGANATGFPSLLVLTGVTDWQDLLFVEPRFRPTYLDQDLRGLLRSQPEVRVERDADALIGRCGATAVRVPVGPRSAAGSAAPESSATPGDPQWWLPDLARTPLVDGPWEDADLGVARALVAVSWAAADSGLVVTDQAELVG